VLALKGRAGLNCGTGAGFIGWEAFCTEWAVWLGIGVGVESPGGDGVDFVGSSIGVNSSEAECVGEVMCANVSDERNSLVRSSVNESTCPTVRAHAHVVVSIQFISDRRGP